MSRRTEVVTRSRWVAVLIGIALAVVPVTTAFARQAPPTHSYGEMVDYDLIFPVAGDYTLSDTFYAARSNGDHHAQDIMSDKMTPIVAAASGTIKYINWTRSASEMWTNGRCCTMAIEHDDGWETWYIHMNNDTPGTDDGLGWGIADGLVPGMHVDAGQLIGWVGDSGNAENTPSHLHFELRDVNDVIVNPYQALLAAPHPSCDTGCLPFQTLARGATGLEVLHLQTMLAVVGFDPGPADGVFGSKTETALIAFQVDATLPGSGVVDFTTWTTLSAAFDEVRNPTQRMAGGNRYETATRIAEETHPDGAQTVFLAVGTNFPDAIGAGPAAAALGAPILLVQTDSLPGVTRTALQRLGPDTVVILGGPVAIGPAVESAVVGLLPGAEVVRLQGATRYETAVAISEFGFPDGADTVYVASGADFPDALVAAPAAIAQGASLLLLRPGSIPAAVGAEITRLGPDRIVVVGGTASVSDAQLAALGGFAPSVERLSGSNRYAGAVAVSAAVFSPGVDTVYIAVGDIFPDALAGGAATAVSNGPLLLVPRDWFPLEVATEIRRLAPSRIVIFGGPVAVSDAIEAILSGVEGTTGPSGSSTPGDYDGPGEIVYDPAAGVEQWRPLVEYVFGLWGLDEEKCGAGDRAGDCIGSQVDNALVIMECESSGDPSVVNSTSGTTGLFQHRPVYWDARVARVRAAFPGFPTTATPFDPEDNVMVAALLVNESRDALLGYNSLTGPWDDGPQPWGHWDGSSRYCASPPLVTP